jgi:predicted enzyme related to lactoylglutathione lyase
MLEVSRTFTSFAVDDVDAARRFYGETLGIEVKVLQDEVGLLELKLAGGPDAMIYRKPDFVPATYTILNFVVADVDAAVDELGGRGVEFERYEGIDQDDKGIATGSPGPRIAWFKDPAGNVLAVLEEPEFT